MKKVGGRILHNNEEVRDELYGVWNQLRCEWNHHLAAFGGKHDRPQAEGGSEKACGACHICEFYQGRLQGINRAIRHFGGRPRR